MTANTILKFLAGICAAAALSSCIHDEISHEPNTSGRDETTVTFALELPNKNKPDSRAATRSLSYDDENEVNSIDILVFEDGGGKYLYKAVGYQLSTDVGESRKKTFKVNLRVGTFDLMVLANSSAIAGDVLSTLGTSATTKTKAEIGALLGTQITTTDKKWASTTSKTGYSPFPMWGEKNSLLINENTSLTGDANSVKLTRMVSRIDVLVSGAAFELTDVYVYNWNTHGSLVPPAAKWNTTDPLLPKATAPEVPAASQRNASTPLRYTGTEIDDVNNKCESEIYLFEAENHTDAAHTVKKDLTDRTCLVIGGKYNGATLPTYYRVDFARKVGTQWDYLDLLRNHQYIANITSVSGPGFGDPDEAFNSAPVNIQAEVLQWNDAGIGDIYFDGQNYLSFRPGNYAEFYKDPETQEIGIKTDVTAGWQITKITSLGADGTTETDIPSGGWLTTDRAVGALNPCGGNYLPLNVSVTDNDTGSPRTGYIYIKAGRVEAKITATQTTAPKKIAIFNFIEYVNVNGTGNNVPATGGTIQAKVNTNVGWAINTNNSSIPNQSMAEPEGQDASNYSLSVQILPMSDLWSLTTTKIWIEYGGLRLQETTYTQTGYNITPPSVPATISENGENITLNLAGYFPAMNFRAVNAADATKAASNVVACTATGSASANSTSSVTLSVYPNSSGASRNIKFQYEKSPGVWEYLATASQQWNGLYSPNAGILAPPGVLGVGATTGKLTLQGSMEYRNTNVATRSDKMGTDEFGNLADETVYVAYFKWGSTVAMSAGTGVRGNLYDKTHVCWTPIGFTGIITDNYESFREWTGSSFPSQDYANGYGDPCPYADKGASAQTYKMPSGNSWNGVSYNSTNLLWTTVNTSLTGITGRHTADWSMFFPTAGVRNPVTGMFDYAGGNDGSGYYWTTTTNGDSYGYSLNLYAGNVSSGNAPRGYGYGVRCVAN